VPSSRLLTRVLELASTQHSLITLGQCRDLGLSGDAARRLVARGAWLREAEGVFRVAGGPRTWQSRAMAAVLTAGPDALVSHRSAAHLWGLEGFGATGRIDVTVPRHRRPRPRRGVVLHESNAFDLAAPTRRRGIAVTGPARTLIDVAAVADDELTVLRALDEIRRLRLATWPDLWQSLLVHATHGRPGIVAARSVIVRRYGRSVPHGEFARLFLLLLERAGLPDPVSEHPLVIAGRRRRIDAAYPRERVAIELDGRVHRLEHVAERDHVRDNQLELAGWIVLRFGWARFSERPGEVVAEVRAALARRRA
jgi:hypothetical protein